jgi:hypothetical protein
MPVIYLRHFVHGTKVAISHEEAEGDIENGWEEFDPVAERLAALQPVEIRPKGRRKLKDVPNFLVSVDDEGD